MKFRLLATTASLALASVAHAQDSAPQASAASDDIVVTGQRAQQERAIEANAMAALSTAAYR